MRLSIGRHEVVEEAAVAAVIDVASTYALAVIAASGAAVELCHVVSTTYFAVALMLLSSCSPHAALIMQGAAQGQFWVW